MVWRIAISPIEELEQQFGFIYLARSRFETPGAQLGAHQAKQTALDAGRQWASEIQNAHLADVSIRWVSEQVGHGLFAERAIAQGAFVGEYTGVVRENNRRYFEPLNPYCYEYPVADSIGRNLVIDATQGNATRFINHSSHPNLQPVYAFLNGFYHCIFLAIRPIAKGHQLSYDYGASYWYLRGAPEALYPNHMI